MNEAIEIRDTKIKKSWCKGKTAKTDNRIISGKRHYNWKGGIYNNPNGYRYILNPEHPKANPKGYLAEHIIIMEKKIGRYLKKGEIVHHINGNKKDNTSSNLKLFKNRKEHGFFHKKDNFILLSHQRKSILRNLRNKLSIKALSFKTRLSQRSIKYHTKILINNNMITRFARIKPQGGLYYIYKKC